MKDKKNDNRCQSIVIELSDGSVGVFTGRVLVEKEGDSRRITRIQFIAPENLPQGINWGKIEEYKNSQKESVNEHK